MTAEVTREINPLWLRLWHWTQAACFLGLLASGLSMHYADAALTPIPFRAAVLTHNACGVAMASLWLLFFIGNRISGNRHHYRLRGTLTRRHVSLQLRYYAYGMFRGESHPFPPDVERKFNPVQKLAYSGVMYLLMPCAIVSGSMLLFPLIAPAQAAGHPGLWPVAMLHLAVGYLLTLFVVFHVYLSTTGERVSTMYREMVSGLRTSTVPPRARE